MMTITLLLAGAALAAAVGLYEAFKHKRGVMGWIVSIVASVVGGVLVGAALPQLVILALRPDGPAALYFGLAGVVAGVLVGSSAALSIVNRFR